jgi:hypothetical protein
LTSGLAVPVQYLCIVPGRLLAHCLGKVGTTRRRTLFENLTLAQGLYPLFLERTAMAVLLG